MSTTVQPTWFCIVKAVFVGIASGCFALMVLAWLGLVPSRSKDELL